MSDGLFVSSSGDGPPTYEYHPLFRQFLLETRRAADPESFLALCRRAASYLERVGEIEESVQVYIMAGDQELGQKVAEGHADELFDWGGLRH